MRRDCLCSIWESNHSNKHVHKPKQLGTMTDSDEGTDRPCVLGPGGLKASDRKNQRLTSSHCLSVSLMVLLGKARCRVSEPSWREEKPLFQREWAASTSVCAPVYVILRAWLLYWHCSVVFDNNDVEPSQIDSAR